MKENNKVFLMSITNSIFHMTIKKITAAIVLLLVTNVVSYSIGSYDKYNTAEALDFEREYANALMEGLHRFYSNDDNDFWFEVFMETPEYHKIDSMNGGDWEDFYYYETPILSYDY